MASALLGLFVAMLLAYLGTLVCKRLKIPRVVGQIIAGMLLTVPILYTGLIDQYTLDAFSSLADIGILLLFFFVGLEINISEFKKNFRTAEAISVLNTIIPFAAGFVVSYYFFGIDFVASLIIAVALSVSAQSVALDFLEESGKLTTRLGRLIVAAGTVDDVNEFLILAFIFTVIGATGGPALAEFAAAVGLFLIGLVFIKTLLYSFVVKFREQHIPATLMMAAFIIIFFYGYLSEFLGFGGTIGALLAGIIVRRTLHKAKSKARRVWEEHEISSSIHTIAFGLFVPMFFVWIGLNTDLNLVLNNLPFLIVALVIAVVGTIGGTMLGTRMNGFSWRESYITGWAMTAKGDVELAVLSLALQRSLITQDLFSVMIITALITSILSPIMFSRLVRQIPAK